MPKKLSSSPSSPVAKFVAVKLSKEIVHDAARGNDGVVNPAFERQVLENLIIETAYEGYASGCGDNLGPCTVSYNDAESLYTLKYQWKAGSTAVSGWRMPSTFNYVSTQQQTETTATNITLFNDWTPFDLAWTSGAATGPMIDLNYANTLLQSLQPALPPERIEIINKKAAALLLQHLDDGQRKTWLAERYFDVKVPSGRRYRVTDRRAHNVFLLDLNGNEVREYCAYARDPGGTLPLEDHLFAQLLTLRFDEQEFLSKANTWDLTAKRVFVGQGVDAGVEQDLLVAAA